MLIFIVRWRHRNLYGSVAGRQICYLGMEFRGKLFDFAAWILKFIKTDPGTCFCWSSGIEIGEVSPVYKMQIVSSRDQMEYKNKFTRFLSMVLLTIVALRQYARKLSMPKLSRKNRGQIVNSRARRTELLEPLCRERQSQPILVCNSSQTSNQVTYGIPESSRHGRWHSGWHKIKQAFQLSLCDTNLNLVI